MFVHTSNRAERLAHILAKVAARPLSPFDPEPIVCGSPGLARWLTTELATRLGVWANGWFPTPSEWLITLHAAHFPTSAPPWRTDTLSLAIAHVLTEMGDDAPRFPDGRARHQLALDLATAVPRWSVFRFEEVRSWEAGAGVGWRENLWRRLIAHLGPAHPGTVAARLVDRFRRGNELVVPPRLHAFDTPLEPAFLSVIHALGYRVPVHVYRIGPSREWWADDTAAEGGVLAALGATWRTEDNRLAELETADPLFDQHDEPAVTTRLGRLTLSWLDLKAPVTAEPDPCDHSLRLLAAAHPAREVEGLRDALLARMAADPTLEPHDILIVAPDLDTYAPLVSALFGDALPHRIADRPLASTEGTVHALHALLDLPGSRLAASTLYDLVTLEPIRRRFGIAADDLDRLHEALAASGMRWGLDAAWRKRRGEPAFQVQTLRHGLDRLLLAAALPSLGDRSFGGVVPADAALSADTLGGFVAFVDAVAHWSADADRKRTLSAWCTDLVAALHRWAMPDDDSDRSTRATLLELGRRAGDRMGSLSLEEAAPWVRDAVGGLRSRSALLGGGITVARPDALRGVPARVIVWLGADADRWPRRRYTHAWDLLATNKAGDPNDTAADRALMLGSVLAARDAWWATFSATEPGTRAERLPSSPLAAIVDAAQQDGSGPARIDLAERPWETTALSGIAPTWEAWALEGMTAALTPSDRPWTLHVDGLAEEVETLASIDVETLAETMSKPANALLRRRLQASAREAKEPLDDVNLLDVDGLERWSLMDRLVRQVEKGADLDRVRAVVQSSGDWPLGSAGTDLFDQLREAAVALVQKARAFRVDAIPPAWAVVPTGPGRVQGWLHNIFGNRRVVLRPGQIRPHHEVAVWIHHLLACAARADFHETLHIGHDDANLPQVIRFRRIESAAEHLSRLHRAALKIRAGSRNWLPKASWALPNTTAFAEAFANELRYDAELARLWHKPPTTPAEWIAPAKFVLDPLRDHREVVP